MDWPEFLAGVLVGLVGWLPGWVWVLLVGVPLLLIAVVVAHERGGLGAAVAVGVVGTLLLIGAVVAVHDAFDTDG